MKVGFRSFALVLLLTSSMIGVSGSAGANRATATAGATIVAPARVNETLRPRGADLFASGVTGDLIIRLPGAFMAGTDADQSRSVIAQLQARIDNGCADRAVTLSDCLRLADQQGLLVGDPVNALMLNATGDDQAGTDGIRVTVSYN